MEAGWWRVGGVAEKQGVSLPRGIGHIPRIPLPHFWTGVGEKGAGGFAYPQRENYKRLSTDFTNSDRYAKIRNEGMHTLNRNCSHGVCSGISTRVSIRHWGQLRRSGTHRRGNRFDRKLQGVFPMLNARVDVPPRRSI